MNYRSVRERGIVCNLRDLVSIFFFKGNIKSKKDPIQLEFATCGFKGVLKVEFFTFFFLIFKYDRFQFIVLIALL